MSKPSMEEQLKSGKILPLLLKLAIPGTIAQIVNALYSMVDRIFIGRMEGVGLTALAGLGLTMPIIQIISAFSYLIGRGGAPLLSIKLGESDRETAAKLQGLSLSLLLILGVVLTAVFYVFCDPILRLFGASAEALPYASSYLKIYVLGTIPVMISLGMNSFLNAQGQALYGTVTVVIGCALKSDPGSDLYLQASHGNRRSRAGNADLPDRFRHLGAVSLSVFQTAFGTDQVQKHGAQLVPYKKDLRPRCFDLYLSVQ